MAAKVVKISGRQGDLDRIKEAAQIVDAGGLVAFPTETVYGIACRVESSALSRLDEIKGRDTTKHYTLHIGQIEEYRRYVPRVSVRAEKLIRQAWPGPLTLVFDLDDADMAEQRSRLDAEAVEALYKDNSVGIRCPDHPVASLLLRMASNPVVAPSANPGGKPPATDAGQVFSELAHAVDMILDGGPCRHSQSSTVATIDRNGVRVLREGAYPAADLQRMAQVMFLFVCTGNTCRSPMAEGFFRKGLAEKIGCTVDELGAMGYRVVSAGTMNMAGVPASAEAVTACARKGVDLASHVSQHLTRSLIDASDFIYCMASSHGEQVIRLSPEAESKCRLLAQDTEIPDPIGQPQEYFDNCAEMIEAAVKARIGDLIL